MVFLGYEGVSYTNKEGKTVQGKNIFCGELVKADLGVGFKIQKWDSGRHCFKPLTYFVSNELFNTLPVEKLEFGHDITFSFNEYGKVTAVTF